MIIRYYCANLKLFSCLFFEFSSTYVSAFGLLNSNLRSTEPLRMFYTLTMFLATFLTNLFLLLLRQKTKFKELKLGSLIQEQGRNLNLLILPFSFELWHTEYPSCRLSVCSVGQLPSPLSNQFFGLFPAP